MNRVSLTSRGELLPGTRDARLHSDKIGWDRARSSCVAARLTKSILTLSLITRISTFHLIILGVPGYPYWA